VAAIRTANDRRPIGRALVLAVVLSFLLPVSGTADGRWLDGALTRWNQAGAAIPSAPPDTLRNDTCRSTEQAATEPAERALAERGWQLVSFWPTVKIGAALLFPGVAFYDGMCRPLQYNVFVFVDADRYAGTLSPTLMDSRVNGALSGTQVAPGYGVKSDGVLAARYLRYRPADPLCCPSGGITEVTYRIETQVAVVDTLAPTIPAALPRTGDAGTWPLMLGVSALILYAGVHLRYPLRVRLRSRPRVVSARPN